MYPSKKSSLRVLGGDGGIRGGEEGGKGEKHLEILELCKPEMQQE